MIELLEQAKEALNKGMGFFLDPSTALEDLAVLRIDDTNDFWKLIILLLEEIKIKKILASKLKTDKYTSIVWESSLLRKNMCLTFEMVNNNFYYVSLKESIP